LSHGTKLTDGEFDSTSSGWPLDKWVAWYNTPFDVVIDLGKPYPVSHIHARAASRTEWAIGYPTKLTISVSSDGLTWRSYGSDISFQTPTGAGWETREVQGAGGWAYDTRFVRYAFYPTAGQHVFLDELWVEGSISHTTKEANYEQVLHGVFPADTDGNLRLKDFESLTGRRASMILWYAGWDAAFKNTVGQIIDDPTSDAWIGDRHLEIGFLPVSPKHPSNPNDCEKHGTCISCTQNESCITSKRIAEGHLDEFLANWFIDAASRNRPLWIRPMNEMNGSWTWFSNDPVDNDHDTHNLRYGGDPLTYRWAWRRMYNIAEQVDATGNNQIFVWAPDVRGTPEDSKRGDPRVYYPGPQYVDWIGFSLYKVNPDETYESLLRSAYSRDYTSDPLWRHPISAKPFMIVEGGSAEYEVVSDAGNTTEFIKLHGCWLPEDRYIFGGARFTVTSLKKPEFIRDWFYRLPLLDPPVPVKAAVWFDHVANCIGINTSQRALQAYRPYFLDR